MSFDQILDRRWYGNSLRGWLIAAAAVLIAILALTILRRALVARMGKVAARTTTPFDDLVVELVRRTRWYFITAVAIEFGTRFITLRPRVDARVGRGVLLFAVLQIGVWGNGVVDFWVARFARRRAAEADTGSPTTVAALGYAARAVLWAIVLAMLLRVFGFNITALVTGLGIGGVAIALAVQNVLGDLFAALAIVLDRPFVIGDSIGVDNISGTVEHIGLKTTRLRSSTGEQIVMSNGELLKSRIRNYKRMIERRVAFTVDVTYDTPPDAMTRIPATLREIVESQSPVRFDRSHFATYTDSALRFETVYWVLVPDYGKFMDIQQAINLELLRRFNAEGIAFAFPTRVVYTQASPPGDTAEDAKGGVTSTLASSGTGTATGAADGEEPQRQ